MTRRDVHVKKSPEEFREYLDKTIRVASTADRASTARGEATDESLPPEEETGRGALIPKKRIPWLQGHRQGVFLCVLSAVLTAVLAMLAWYGSTLFRLNREVGVATTTSATLEKDQSRLDESLNRLEDRLGREVDGLNSRIDRLVDTRNTESKP